MKCRIALVLGERDAFCFAWLVSVSTKPGFIEIAGPVQIPVFPSGEVPRKRHCKAAQVQLRFCRTLLGCFDCNDSGIVAGHSMWPSPWCLQTGQADGRCSSSRLALLESKGH